jgi:glycosyltransferase involved in cell wall biosynthesis
MEPLAIILPAHNEEKTIEATVSEFAKVAPHALIVVVDNASDDSTAYRATRAFLASNCRGLLLHESKKGKGNAVQTAFSAIKAEIYIVADADYTYPANQLYELIAPIQQGSAAMVVGDRLSNGVYKKTNYRAFHNVGNVVISSLVNILFKSNLNDVLSGYRALSRNFVKNMPVVSGGFELEVEMTIYALKTWQRICEIPIYYRNRPLGSISKLSTFKDGAKVVSHLLYNFLR